MQSQDVTYEFELEKIKPSNKNLSKTEKLNYEAALSCIQDILAACGIGHFVITSTKRDDNPSSQHSDASAIDFKSPALVSIMRRGGISNPSLAAEIYNYILTEGGPIREFIIEHMAHGMRGDDTIFHLAVYSRKFNSELPKTKRFVTSLRYRVGYSDEQIKASRKAYALVRDTVK